MISHKLEEDSLSKLFLKFGPIEDCKILRDLNGRSKCCAFITFKTKQSAANAIKFMHHNLIMENCHYPLNVNCKYLFALNYDTLSDFMTDKFY